MKYLIPSLCRLFNWYSYREVYIGGALLRIEIFLCFKTPTSVGSHPEGVGNGFTFDIRRTFHSDFSLVHIQGSICFGKVRIQKIALCTARDRHQCAKRQMCQFSVIHKCHFIFFQISSHICLEAEHHPQMTARCVSDLCSSFS